MVYIGPDVLKFVFSLVVEPMYDRTTDRVFDPRTKPQKEAMRDFRSIHLVSKEWDQLAWSIFDFGRLPSYPILNSYHSR